MLILIHADYVSKNRSLNCLIKKKISINYNIQSIQLSMIFFYRGSRLYIFFQSDSRCKNWYTYVKIKGKITHARAINN